MNPVLYTPEEIRKLVYLNEKRRQQASDMYKQLMMNYKRDLAGIQKVCFHPRIVDKHCRDCGKKVGK
jgi:hypothetical protein